MAMAANITAGFGRVISRTMPLSTLDGVSAPEDKSRPKARNAALSATSKRPKSPSLRADAAASRKAAAL